MADLTNMEKRQFERLLGMGSGYVLDFSNRTFAEFVVDATGRDPYDAKYDNGSSKANRLRGFSATESNRVVGKLMADMLEYSRTTVGGNDDPALRSQCERTVARLLQDNPVRELEALVAVRSERDFEFVAKAVRDAIDRDEAGSRSRPAARSSSNTSGHFVKNEEALLIFNHVAASIRFLRSIDTAARERERAAAESVDDDIPF